MNYNNNEGSPNPDCTKPYANNSSNDYCQTQYCQMIKTMVELDISMVQRATYGGGNHECLFFPGESYYNAVAQTVKDINYAYDCAGKMRPVIQGMVFEFTNPDNFLRAEEFDNNPNNPVDYHIPMWLVEKYFQYFPDDFFNKHYYSVPRFFKKERIYTLKDNVLRFDIRKTEMRMWFLYQALTQINMGYTALHMGIYYEYDPTRDEPERDYALLDQLTSAIRSYALERVSEGHPGFVLLSGEPPMQNVDHGLSAQYNGHFIFDFDSRALRPREVAPDGNGSGNITGDGNPPNGCNSDITTDVNELRNSLCGQGANLSLMAVVDPCTENSFGGTVSGITPTGCFVSQLPYTCHFDGFARPDINKINLPTPGPADGYTWGYNPHKWFSLLTPECQKLWFDYFFCSRKDFHNGLGSIVIPGILTIDPDLSNDPVTLDNGMQLLCDDQLFVKQLKEETLKSLPPQISYSEECENILCRRTCNGVSAPKRNFFLVGTTKCRIQISNTDCTSTYSIHIKDPNGVWLPMKLGEIYEFYPRQDGTYEVHVRQDNLGITPATSFGTIEVVDYIAITRFCCTGEYVDEAYCFKKPGLTLNCLNTDPSKDTYSFNILSDSSIVINDVFSNLDVIRVISKTKQSDHEINGTLEVWDKSLSEVNLVSDIRLNQNRDSLDIKSVIPNCNSNGNGTTQRTSNEDQDVFIPIKMENSVLCYPNPTNEKLNVQFYSTEDKLVSVSIFNTTSQNLKSQKFHATAGENRWVFSISDLPNGCYWLSLTSDNFNKSIYIIKQ